MDREHHPVAEFVIDVAAFVLRQHAGALEQLQPALVGAQRVLERGVAVGGVAQGEAGAVVRIHAAAVQIVARARAVGELALVELGRRLQCGVLVAQVAVLVVLPGFLRHFDAGAAGQFLYRVEELEAVVVHQEADRGAVRAAAEAVVELLGR